MPTRQRAPGGGMEFTQQFVGGSWRGAVAGGTKDLLDPATGDRVATMAFGDGQDAVAAIEAAAAALDEWAEMGPYRRAVVLRAAADLIEANADRLGAMTTSESGKPITESVAEWLSAPNYLRFAAEEAKRLGGRIIPPLKQGRRIEVTYRPLGVVGVIAAWNFPVYNVNRAVSSALAAGCTVVVRPSEYTPRSALAYASMLHEAGAPSGVVNVINGEPSPMAQVMLDDPRLRKIQFTGSSRVGKLLMDGASRTVTRLSLELGGNAPVIVMPDVDVDSVVAGAVAAKYRNGGQACIAPQRFIVHESIAPTFADAMTARSAALKVGDPSDPETELGPMVNERQRNRVEEIVDSSVAAGARLRTGGRRIGDRGWFYEPTVLDGAVVGTAAMEEEIFGPVAPVASFSALDEAIALANSTEHGLTSFVWTADLGVAYDLADRLEFGMVGVNDWFTVSAEAPFGGVKAAGLGRESGTEGLLEYLEPQTRFFSRPS